MPKVLFINGIKDDGRIRVRKIIDNNTLQYFNEGTCNVYNMLKNNNFESSLLTLDANLSQDINLDNIDIIFNQISDPDTHKVSLAKANLICDKVKDQAFCINHPLKIINSPRERLPELLQNIPGIIVPQTIRFSPTSASQVKKQIENLGWPYPVLIRRCGDHNARSLVLLEQPEQASDIDPAYFENECYLTEFIDFSDNNGVYTKYRFVCVQGKVFIRHIMYGDHWEIHSQVRKNFMKKNSSYFDLEKEIILSFDDKLKKEIQKPIHDIYKALGLDYFGVDCSIDAQGKLIIFEANANMNLIYNPYPKPNAWQSQVEQIQNALNTMIQNSAETPAITQDNKKIKPA